MSKKKRPKHRLVRMECADCGRVVELEEAQRGCKECNKVVISDNENKLVSTPRLAIRLIFEREVATIES